MSGFTDRRRAVLAAGLATAIIAGMCFVLGPKFLVRRGARTSETLREPTLSAPPGARGGPPLADLDEIDRTSSLISARTGGELQGPSGRSTVRFPAGALPGDAVIEIARYAVTTDGRHDGFAFDLKPDGLRFDIDVEVEIALPPGIEPNEAEVTVYDPVEDRWVPEPRQEASAEGGALIAHVDHFSLRRIRIRPGMDFPGDARAGRATFYLEADAGNTFERYLEGRWRAVAHKSAEYRELMKIGRTGRNSLIASGRLRAITGARPKPEVFRDHRRTVAMPSSVPEARTGWVRLTVLDRSGTPTLRRVVARVNDFGPGRAARTAGVVVDMSRATAEALGLVWDRDFGLSDENPNVAWIRFTPPDADAPRRHVPVRVEPYDPLPSRAFSCRYR